MNGSYDVEIWKETNISGSICVTNTFSSRKNTVKYLDFKGK